MNRRVIVFIIAVFAAMMFLVAGAGPGIGPPQTASVMSGVSTPANMTAHCTDGIAKNGAPNLVQLAKDLFGIDVGQHWSVVPRGQSPVIHREAVLAQGDEVWAIYYGERSRTGSVLNAPLRT